MRSSSARSLARLGAAVLGFAAGAMLAREARSGDEDRIHWQLPEGDAFRYDLEDDDKARVAPDAGLAPLFQRSQILTVADFDDARRPKMQVRDVADLVWWFSLEAPAGEFSKKGAENAVSERFTPPGGGAIIAKGKEQVSRPKGDFAIKTTLDLSQEAPAQGSYLESGTLTIDRVFQKKMLKEAHYALEVKRKNGDKLLVFRNEGRIACAGKVELGGKQILRDVAGAITRSSRWLNENLSKRLGGYKAAKDIPPDALGYVALPTFALLRSGVPASQLKDAFDFMARCPLKHTYSVALYVMALEAKSVRRDEVPPQAGGRTVARFVKGPTPAADKAEIARLIKWLVNTRLRGGGTWNYFGNPGRGDDGEGGGPIDGDGGRLTERCDHSISQFAVLALHVGDTSGVAIPEAVFAEVVKDLTTSQETSGPDQSIKDVEWTAAAPPGIPPEAPADPFGPPVTRARTLGSTSRDPTHSRGWTYGVKVPQAPNSATGSMSGACLSSLLVAREGLRRQQKLDNQKDVDTCRAARDGVAWFVKNWNPTINPPGGQNWYFYYLYSVEKAMEIAGIEKLGAREWWREGAAEILGYENKKTSGFSLKGDANMEDTSFALLFLNRATLPARIVTEETIKVATGEKDDADAWDKVFVEGTGHVKLRSVLYALETATPDVVPSRLKLAEKGFDMLEEDRRPRLVPDLLRLAGTGDRTIRRFVARALRVATGTEDEGKARAFHARWSELVRMCDEMDYEKIPATRQILKEPDATASFALKRAACLALARLRAVEAAPDLLPFLEDKDPLVRRFGATALVQLVGPRADYDPQAPDADRAKQVAAWRDWWRKDGPQAVFDEEIRRDVELLAVEDAAGKAAEARLKTKGKRCVRGLIDGLKDEKTRAHCRRLLEDITGERYGDDPAAWLAWLEGQKKDGQ